MFTLEGDASEHLIIDADSGHVAVLATDCIGSAGVWFDPEEVESVVSALRAAAVAARQQLANRELGALKP